MNFDRTNLETVTKSTNDSVEDLVIDFVIYSVIPL